MRILQNTVSGQLAREKFYKRVVIVSQYVFWMCAIVGAYVMLSLIAWVVTN